MPKNLGDADRVARMFLAAAPAATFRQVHGTGGLVMAIVAMYLLATSLTAWCLIYALIRVNTTRPDDAKSD